MSQMLWHTDEVPGIYLASLCCWREARGEPTDGQRAVLHVIHNRALSPCWWGDSLASIILKPYQFSSFNYGDPNSTKFPEPSDPIYLSILTFTEKVMTGQDQDLTGGATYYHTQSVSPEWDKKLTKTASIGNQVFFK